MISPAQPWPPLSRNDRHVRRASLRLPAGVSEHCSIFLVEEALRLMALPGEDQGRTYFFRRVAMRGLAAAAPSSEWIDRAQSTMSALAARALHGGALRAADADAIFFNTQQEALEWLLGRLFRASPRGVDVAEWFAAMICPAASGTNISMQVVAVIERLRSLPSGWFAAATAILHVLYANPASADVLESIPERVVREWLWELSGASERGGSVLRISGRGRHLLHQRLLEGDHASLSYWDGDDSPQQAVPDMFRGHDHDLPSHLVWLAAITVAAEYPCALDKGAAVASGRKILKELGDVIGGAPAVKDFRQTKASPSRGAQDALDTFDRERLGVLAEATLDHVGVDRDNTKKKAIVPSHCTAAGGFYFLLNALQRLSIEKALEALPERLRFVFLPKLIESLARSASVADSDPVLLSAKASLEGADQEYGCIIPADCWPRMLLAGTREPVTPARLVRVWTVAVRRWCWLHARLTLREVVLRPGRILLTRTDLDVTLPMDTVDLRLRRAGLDLDLGWLPWFGRVVRFHYVDEPSLNVIDWGERV